MNNARLFGCFVIVFNFKTVCLRWTSAATTNHGDPALHCQGKKRNEMVLCNKLHPEGGAVCVHSRKSIGKPACKIMLPCRCGKAMAPPCLRCCRNHACVASHRLKAPMRKVDPHVDLGLKNSRAAVSTGAASLYVCGFAQRSDVQILVTRVLPAVNGKVCVCLLVCW